MCGVPMKFGKRSNSLSVGGSTANASIAAAAMRRDCERSRSAASSMILCVPC
jgi:hypothetical protein